ncbi:type VI secretion system tip protein TssI/VgrG [Sorangium sp. So ce136]|uniref:type VI secretion system Vgr family protein n=1 Tax=Sorangium sp. So ce136 TaxID=3133284 RepID=UPI003F0B0C88
MAVLITLADPALQVECRELVGEERLGEAFRLEAVLLSQAPIAAASVLGQPAAITLCSRHGERTLAGVVTRWTAVGTSRAAGARDYRVCVRPRLALLELRRRSRVYQHLTVPSIVKKVLEEGGYAASELQLSLGEPHPPREYVVQYDETDAAFVRRLCEEEGIYLRTFAEDGAERVTIEDRSAGAADALGEAIALVAHEGLDAERPCLFDARAVRRRRPGKVLLRDHDPERPALDLEATREEGAPVERAAAVYEAPGRFRDAGGGGDRARVRLESLRADAREVFFRTTALALAPGLSFEVDPLVDASGAPPPSGAHVVVAVRHRYAASDLLHVVDLEAIPRDVPFRLARVTPRPCIPGLQSAFVTGAPGEEIHPDALGRVFARFHWDVDGPGDASSSLPVRVLQPNMPGSMLIPRVGWEVLVAFEDGDPERPYVLGRSYTARMPPPFPLPANKTITSLATDSSPGGGGRHAVYFDDAKGREHLKQQAPFDKETTVGDKMLTQVVNNERYSVARGQTRLVASMDATAVVQSLLEGLGSRNIVVGSFHALTVGGDMGVSVGREFVGVAGALVEHAGNPVKGLLNLGVSKALAWVGSRGVAGAVVAAGLGIAKSAAEGYASGGRAGAEEAAKAAGVGVLAGMIPGGEAVLAHVNGATRPNPWDHGKPAEGAPEPGGGAGGGAGDAAGPGGPGPGHRKIDVKGAAIEVVGGYAVATPGQIGWTTLGTSTLVTGGTKQTRTTSASFQAAGGSVESVGSRQLLIKGKISRKSLVRVSLKTTGALTVNAASWLLKAPRATVKAGGALTLAAGTVTFRCGEAEITATPGGVSMQAPRIEITGVYEQSEGMSHV